MLVSILDYIDNAAENYPNKTAFVEGENCITFQGFRQKVLVRASGILRGIQQSYAAHKPIVLMQEKGIDELVSFMAIAGTGNIYVPFDTEAPDERLNKMLDFLNPLLIITDEKNYERTKRLNYGSASVVISGELDVIEAIDRQKLLQIRKEILDTDPLYIICTSGSTGTPKGVVVSHRSVIDFTEEASERMEFSSEEKFISQGSFYFDLSVLDIYCTLRNVAELHIVPKQWYTFPIRVLKYIEQKQINALMWIPSALIMTANVKLLEKVDLNCLKKIMFCGEVMPNKKLNIWRKAVPNARYVNYYGPAEATCASTYYVIDREFSDDEPLPIGKPAHNTGILILNEEYQPAGDGEIGELFIRGSGLALGYYKDTKKTEEAFIQNPLNGCYKERIYRTGDLVKVNEYGELIYIGRKDFQIKHMGYRIELGEIEISVNSMQGMHMSCCLYDNEKKMIILIYQGDLEEAEVIKLLRERVPHYMIPKTVIKIEQMPLNANGKIDRVKLKEYIEG